MGLVERVVGKIVIPGAVVVIPSAVCLRLTQSSELAPIGGCSVVVWGLVCFAIYTLTSSVERHSRDKNT